MMESISKKGSSVLDKSFAPQALSKNMGESVPFPGKATAKGTQINVARSVAFEQWMHQCPEPVGWCISKLGSTTCKAEQHPEDAADATQLAALKGINYFEIPAFNTQGAKSVAKAIMEVVHLFDVPREGIVTCVRAGLFYEEKDLDRRTQLEAQNLEVIRKRAQPAMDRVRNTSFPGMMMMAAMKYSQMSDEQLKALNLRRVSTRCVAAITPKWIEAALASIQQHVRFETIDILLIEGIETLWDGRPESEIEKDLTELFTFLESYAENSVIQYYGVCTPNLAPPVKRVYPELPKDHMVPPEFLPPTKPPHVINLDTLLNIARKVGGENHHFRFTSIPMNLTEHTGYSAPLPYNKKETFVSYARKQGLTVLGHRPIETRDLMGKPQRYHNFHTSGDIGNSRKRAHALLEQVVKLEMDAKPFLEKLSAKGAVIPYNDFFHGSLLVVIQRQIDNLFSFQLSYEYQIMPPFFRAMQVLRQSSIKEFKDWTRTFETSVKDMWMAKKDLLTYRHAKKSDIVIAASEKLVPRIVHCPILTQRALNFAATAVDVVCTGLHNTRYVHEAVVLNPARCGEFVFTPEEMKALCNNDDVSFANHNPPHPYMMEPPFAAGGTVSGQKPKSMEHMVPIDPNNPIYPDDPEYFYKKKAQDEKEQKLKEEAEKEEAEKAAAEASGTSTTTPTEDTSGKKPE